MRQSNWAYKLGEYVNSIHRTGFAFGKHDCGVLAAGCIKALTGVDAMPAMKYSSADEAARECHRICGSSHVDDLIVHLAKQHGWVEVKPPFAQRGDLVVMGSGSGARLGVVSLHGTHIMTPGDKGLMYEHFNRRDASVRIFHV